MTLLELQDEIDRIIQTYPRLTEIPIVNMDCFIYNILNDCIIVGLQEDKIVDFRVEEIL